MRTGLVFTCFVFLLPGVFQQGRSSYIYMPGLPEDCYSLEGDFNLGIFVPVHNYSMDHFCADTVRNMGVLQRIEGIRFVIEEINKSPTILPDHKLGFFMYDDCYKGITALAQSLHFIEQPGEGECLIEENIPEYCFNESIVPHEVVGIIGSESSITTVQLANLFSSFQIPQISYLATSSSLTNKYSYPHFRRMVSPDTLQAKVIVSLLLHYNWSYVSVVHMEGEYGAKGYQNLYSEGYPKGVCFAEVFEVSSDFEFGDYQGTVFMLLQENKAQVVVVITPLEQARKLMAAAQRLSVDGRITWVATDAWARDINELAGYEEVAYGMMSVKIRSTTVSRFDEHYTSLRVDTPTQNPWIGEFYEQYHGCAMTNKTGSDLPMCDPSLRMSDHKDYLPDNIVSLVFDSVYTFAHGLHAAVESPKCAYLNKTQAMKCARYELRNQLMNLTFQGENRKVIFDDVGDIARDYSIFNLQNNSDGYHFVPIATWYHETEEMNFLSGKAVQWSSGEQPQSFCSFLCGVGEQQFLQQKRCCWVCETCQENQYTREFLGAQRCYSCENRTWPDPETRTKCEPIVPDYPKWHDALGICLIILATSGLLVSIGTTVVFVMNNNDPLIKASSRELSYFMLAGVIINFAVVFCFIMKPTNAVCFMRFLGISICFTFLYAPLVTKTIRIYRIFDAGNRMNRRPTCVSSMSQIGIAFNMLLLHLCIIVAWACVVMPTTKEFQPTLDVVHLTCEFPIGPLASSLVYNGILVLASMFFAFKTRKLPGNYNESKFICFCVYSTVVIWCAFVPAYFAVGNSLFKVMFLSLVVLANGTLILCCMFLPKVYALYFVDEEDLQVSPQFMKQKGTRRLVEEISGSTNSDINRTSEKMPEKVEEKVHANMLEKKVHPAARDNAGTTSSNTIVLRGNVTKRNPSATTFKTKTEDASTSMADFPFQTKVVYVSPAPSKNRITPVDLWF